MNYKQAQFERQSGLPAHPQRAATVASVLTGAVAGAAIGIFAFAGLIIVLVGAFIGALAGGAIGKYVRERSKRERARDAILDREIGVTGGDIGIGPAYPRYPS
jgi:hypothetical protein